MHIVTTANIKMIPALVQIDPHCTLGTMHNQLERIGVASGKTAGMDHTQSTIFQLNIHNGTVIGIQRIVANAIILSLVKGFQLAGNFRYFAVGSKTGKIQNMNADIAQHTKAAMRFGQAPQPALFCLPVAPVVAHQPALAIAGFKMAHFTNFAITHQFMRKLNASRISVGQIDHANQILGLNAISHFLGQWIGFGQRLFAKHMFARSNQRHGGGMMDGIRRHI